MTTAYALVAPLRLGEDAKRHVRTLGAARSDLRVGRRDNLIYIPLARPIDPPFPEARVEVAEFVSSRPPKSYKEIVQVPDRVRSLLPTSFDIVGDLVVIKVPDALRVYGPAIAAAILKVHKNVRGVFHDDGVDGPFRIRRLVPLAGEARTRTTHAEFGARFDVDLSRAYFSPRLANEHHRVAAQVGPDEIVADATAGVGPFAVLIGRRRGAAKILAIDLNPDAVALLRVNVERHGLEGRVEVVQADALQALDAGPDLDRAIVNLPHGGEDILVKAAGRVRPGGRLHYYRVWPEAERDGRLGELVARIMRETGRTIKIADVHVVHAYSPTDRMWSVDLDVA